MTDLSALPDAALAALAGAVAAELSRRGRTVPARQGALFDDIRPLTPDDFDPDATLPDGSRRWIWVKEAAFLANCSADAIERRVKTGAIGVKIGGRLWIDRMRLRRGH